ncbi:MAG: helix-turn-helix transcriptional regulator, partial [Siculibacillus sp.]
MLSTDGAAQMCRSVNLRGFAMATAVANLLDHLRNDAGLQGKDIANVMAVSPATVSRWMSGKASPDLKTQLIMSDLRFVADRLAEFYQPDETRL